MIITRLDPDRALPYQQCILELPGALVGWSVLDPPESLPQLTILDFDACDWLWRLVGEHGHLAVVDALRSGTDPLDLPLTVDPVAAGELRRLAYGHWLRRWWPASAHGPVPVLDPVLLDLELAVLTHGAQAWFTEDTLDSDPAALLARWSSADLGGVASDPTPGARDLVAALLAAPDELVPHWTIPELATLASAVAGPTRTRRDFALAAGGSGVADRGGVIAAGRTSADWAGVPPGILDAAEDTVSWSVEAAPAVQIEVQVVVLPGADASGIGVRLSLPPHLDLGAALDTTGQVRVPLPIPAATAWRLPWGDLRCDIGRGGDGSIGRAPRDAVRQFVRRRLADPTHPDLFVAERAAADVDY